MKELKKLAETCDTVIERMKEFHKVYQKQWFFDNKPFGFDIQDIRIGGTIQRIKSCKQRILDFADVKVDKIPELDEERVESRTLAMWSRTVSPNVISHVF